MRLVADVGGTNVRFALADEAGRLAELRTYRGIDFASFADALEHYTKVAKGMAGCNACCIGAAGPVDDGRVRLTNTTWSIDRDEITRLLAGVPVTLVNDLQAVAAALPHLVADDVKPLGGPMPVWPANRTMLAVNIGTGFGAASAIRHGSQWSTSPSEAGHMTLGVIEAGKSDLMPVNATIESLFSGKGLGAFYSQLGGSDCGTTGSQVEAVDVFARAGHDAAAALALELFTACFGRVAGDLALATAAWGGVFLCGSVAVGWSAVADIKRFRTEFMRKGPMRARMEQVPTAIIRHENVSLYGLAMMPISG